MLLLLICLVCAVIGAMVMQSKNRPAWQGALWGFLLGFIGILICACMPKLPENKGV